MKLNFKWHGGSEETIVLASKFCYIFRQRTHSFYLSRSWCYRRNAVLRANWLVAELNQTPSHLLAHAKILSYKYQHRTARSICEYDNCRLRFSGTYESLLVTVTLTLLKVEQTVLICQLKVYLELTY